MRIRTVKPELFRHEKLNELAEADPASQIIVFYIGLWGLADNQGVFEWRPKHIKLDILPFTSYDPEKNLETLEREGFIERFSCGGKEYGCIPTFKAHQRISGKEKEDGARYPSPSMAEVAKGKQIFSQGKPEPMQGTQEKEKEKEEEKEREDTSAATASAPETSVAISSPRPPSQLKDDLAAKLEAAMLSKAALVFWASPGKERAAIGKLTSLARHNAPGAEDDWMRRMLEKYWALTQGSDRFWSSQPFTPSAMLAHAERIAREAARADHETLEPDDADDIIDRMLQDSRERRAKQCR